eukprot:4148916-Lingulodinium_polyedra.AAC.1
MAARAAFGFTVAARRSRVQAHFAAGVRSSVASRTRSPRTQCRRQEELDDSAQRAVARRPPLA